jgi:hypothetical protein
VLQPSRNQNGELIPHDDLNILNEHGIIRRISAHYIVSDPKEGGSNRISSMAFRPSSDTNGGMSIDLQHEIEEAGLDPRVYVTTPVWIGSVRFLVEHLRTEGFMIGSDPTEQGAGGAANPYHGQVWGNFSKSKQRRLQQLCEWFVPIEGVALGPSTP